MIDRYSRQILFAGIGRAGQAKIRAGRVILIGCGALGSVGAEMLARAGVGHLTLVDRDVVEASNLQRQSLFTEKDAVDSVPKAVAAEKALRAINSDVEVRGIVQDVTSENIGGLVEGSELVLDGTDNFEVRFLINDYCVKNGLPWVYGAALGSYGVSSAIVPQITPCLRCFCQDVPFAGAAETCETVGILGPVVHMVSAFQVAQVLRLLVGAEVSREIFQVDVWSDNVRTVRFAEPLESCPCCVRRDFRFLQGREQPFLTKLCGRNAVQVYPVQAGDFDLEGIAQRLRCSLEVQSNEYLLRASAGEHELVLFYDGRAIVKGTDDCAKARAVYAKYVGN